MRWSLALAQVLAGLALWIGGGSGHKPAGWCRNPSLCAPLPADHQFQVEKTFNDKLETLKNLPQLLIEIAQVFHREIPGSQVSLGVPWSPSCESGRCYNYAEVAEACDFLLVMSFDMWRQGWGECFAKSSAPYQKVLSGLSGYISLGVDPRKLILGVPWFGNNYECKHFLRASNFIVIQPNVFVFVSLLIETLKKSLTSDIVLLKAQMLQPGRCELLKIPFKGAACNPPVGKMVQYKEVMQELPKSITGRYWDDNYQSPFYVYKVENLYHEICYDDPESLSLKSSIMKKLKLHGIGALFGNSLNYSANPTAVMQTEEMWNALCKMENLNHLIFILGDYLVLLVNTEKDKSTTLAGKYQDASKIQIKRQKGGGK
ncbi:di-N-acetylchitobiase-like [Carcharodon carcharias]|uniref:di-N-acetylchitobiase-like n=1 Tax=Carcharodon carcharias TaxID=13397 RepID=UPI001B7F43E9|nr:di-N-acetylchitobiase-like [Carcharodon carcharias]